MASGINVIEYKVWTQRRLIKLIVKIIYLIQISGAEVRSIGNWNEKAFPYDKLFNDY